MEMISGVSWPHNLVKTLTKWPGLLDGQRLAYSKGLAGTGIYVEHHRESVSLKGGSPTRISIKPKVELQGFCWLPDGRIVYSLRQSVNTGADSNLWEVRTITQTGEPTWPPPTTNKLAGVLLLRSSRLHWADGKQMEFLRLTAKAHVYVGELDAKGTHPLKITHAASRSTNISSGLNGGRQIAGP